MSKAILVSACLLGLNTRYSGVSKDNARVVRYLQQTGLIPIPVCPEQLGGLPTPRPASDFHQGTGRDILQGEKRIFNQNGNDVTEPFVRGAREVLKIAGLAGCTAAILKERSPSCGVNWIYCQGQLAPGSGVTTTLLRDHQLHIFSEEELPEL